MYVHAGVFICVSVHLLYHVSLKENFDYSPAQGPVLLSCNPSFFCLKIPVHVNFSARGSLQHDTTYF